PVFSGEKSLPDSRPLFDHALANGDAQSWFSRGDYAAAVRGSRPLAATYFVAPSQHLGLEPQAATARIGADGAEVWQATLAPGFGKSDAATLYPMAPGEPAGQAMEPVATQIALELARAIGRPVQLTLSQSSSQNHDRVAPGAPARLSALPGDGGITAAWRMRVATADGLGSALARLGDKDPPAKFSRSGLSGSVPPYSIPNVDIEAVRADLPFAAGYMRGSPERELAFFTES